MEDSHIALIKLKESNDKFIEKTALFGVFDGHGGMQLTNSEIILECIYYNFNRKRSCNVCRNEI
jgi:serine/threonine protein phosphatase PrpC